jgi:DnaK suppressor protein
MKMNPTKQRELRKRLEERKAEIEGDVNFMAAEIRALGVDQDMENGSLGNHIADDGTNVFEAERIVTISDDLQDILAQVNAAIERMDAGTYGTCGKCGKPIGAERLEAFPYVALCIECQSRLERDQALRGGAQ